MNFQDANKVVHKVEDQWHYRILTEFGFKVHTSVSVGFVRRYEYKRDGYVMICATGASSDYWNDPQTDASGYHGTLEQYVKAL